MLKSCIRSMWVILFACVLLSLPVTGQAQKIGKLKKEAPPQEVEVPADLAPEKVDSYVAGLSDEQARRLFVAELKEKTALKSDGEIQGDIGAKDKGLVLGFFAAQRALTVISDRIAETVAGVRSSDEARVWEQLVGGKGSAHFFTAMALLVLIVFMGWAAEKLLLSKTERLRSRLLKEIPRGGWDKAGLVVSRLMLDIVGIGIYVLVSFFSHFIIYGQRQPAYLVSSGLILTYYFRLIEAAARLSTSPKAPELRLVRMSDGDARLLYNWIVWMTISVIPGSALALALQKSGASRELFLFVYSIAGPTISILLAAMIWQMRHRVASLICPSGEPSASASNLVRQRCALYWHYPAILFTLTVGAYWWVRVLTQADVTIVRLIMSLFLVPLCIGIDQWLQQMLTQFGGKPREIIDFSTPHEGDSEPEEFGADHPAPQENPSGKDITIYFPLIRKTFRFVLLVFLFFAALDLWGVEFDMGWIFARSILGVIIALVLGLLVWEVVKARIDQRIKEETPLQSEEFEEGGSGGSRSGTLLLLLRKFIMVFLFLVISFSILASLGVNIAPLLAGAGVVGLAIGFGAQTLVKDIISGVFFLIDDAFRVGDYVEAGTAKGTVEAISIRSLRLRHPRGQVFVVPFGDLKMVQNFTRDYIVEKLDIRVRFDTDPDAIRKIIKKINKEMKADEEFAGVLLSDIKSAGVRAMDDSAMILRVKFRCIPGEQFILRREVYHRIQKAFKQKGIEFAHRNVTVYLPPQPASSESPASAGGVQNLTPEVAGAAAAAAIAQAEAEALAKLTEKKKAE